MNKKLLALSLLALAAHADDSCAAETPWGTQNNHMSAELAFGTCAMTGSPYSLTESGKQTTSWTYGVNEVETPGNLKIEAGAPVYDPGWSNMTPMPNRLGFAGHLGLNYMAVHGHMAAGVYASVGYNGSHSSSALDNGGEDDAWEMGSNKTAEVQTIQNVGTEDSGINNEGESGLSLAATPGLTKATVSSGVQFSVGGRLGAMIGNVFPHLRMGWAAYQLKAHMDNQYAPGVVELDAMLEGAAAATGENQGTDASIDSAGLISPATLASAETTISMVEPEDGYAMPSKAMKLSSKAKWTNALTLGAGVDFAFQKMVLGFYYQAAICQRVTFDKWNKDVTDGSGTINFTTVSDNGVTNDANTWSALKQTYAAGAPKLSISPVLSSWMASIKYVFHKA